MTQLANLSRHMELLSRYLSHSVVFMVRSRGSLRFEVAAHGLERDMGLTRQRFEAELNDQSFYRRVDESQREELWRSCMAIFSTGQGFSSAFTLHREDGRTVELFMKADYVNDPESDVQCILSLRRAEE